MVSKLLAGLLALTFLLVPAARSGAAHAGHLTVDLAASPNGHLGAETAGSIAANDCPGVHNAAPATARSSYGYNAHAMNCCPVGFCIADSLGYPTALARMLPYPIAAIVYRGDGARLPAGLGTSPALHPPNPAI